LLELNQTTEKDYNKLDSFVIYICLEGELQIETESGSESVQKGETILIPASIENVQLKPLSAAVKLLEVYVDK
jgi:mannose-6-phosphate isomerase